MSARKPAEGERLRARTTAPLIAVLALVCCLVTPLVAGAIGAVAIGSLLGVAAGAILLAGLCGLALRHLRTSDRRC